MYHSGNYKGTYTWNVKWEIPYESAWSRIEKYRLVNQITISSQMTSLFAYDRGQIKYDYENHIFKYGTYLLRMNTQLIKLDNSPYGLFTNYQSIIDKRLRYCPECIKYGYHSVFHQMRVFDKCVFHPHERLDYMCNCEKESYVLHTKKINKYNGYICSGCGKILPHMPSIAEGICGKWDYANLAREISEWDEIWKKRMEHRISMTIIDINEKNRMPGETHIYNKYKEIVKEFLITGDILAMPVLVFRNTIFDNLQYLPRGYYRQILKYRLEKYKIFHGVQAVCEYIKTEIERDKYINTYNEIIRKDLGCVCFEPFDKNKCDPESAILLFLIKKLRDGMVVRDALSLDMRDEKQYDNSYKRFLAKITMQKDFESNVSVLTLFNYVYAEYIKSYYNFLKQCFYYNEPCKFPKTARDNLNDENWEFPAYVMIHNMYGFYLFSIND